MTCMRTLLIALAFTAGLRAQQVKQILMIPDAAHFTAGMGVSFSTLTAALAAVPAGSTTAISVPSGYAETAITTTHTMSTANVSIVCANGASFKSGAAGVAPFTVAANNLSFTGCIIDGHALAGGIAGGAGAGSLSGLTLDRMTFQTTGSSYALTLGNSSDTFSSTSVQVKNSVFTSTGGILIYDPDDIQITGNRFATVNTNDAVHLYGRNCGTGYATQCPGRNILVADNYATGLGRMFAEIQGNFTNPVVRGNTASGHTCTTNGGSCYCISFVAGYGGDVADNWCTFGAGSGAAGTVTMSANPGEVSSVAVGAAGTGYTQNPFVRLQDVEIDGAYPVFTTTIAAGGLASVTVAQAGSQISTPDGLARLQIIPATPAAITTTPCLEIGNQNANVDRNHCFGYGTGITQDFTAGGVHYRDNELVHQNTTGVACGNCTDTKYVHNRFEEQGSYSILQTSTSNTRGLELSGNTFLRTVIPADASGTPAYTAMAMAASPGQSGDAPWSIHDNSIISGAATPTIASANFQGLNLVASVAGARYRDNNFISISSAYGRVISAATGSAANMVIAGNYSSNAEYDFFIPADPDNTLLYSDNTSAAAGNQSQIDRGTATKIMTATQVAGTGTAPAWVSGFGGSATFDAKSTTVAFKFTAGAGVFTTGVVQLNGTYSQTMSCWVEQQGNHGAVTNDTFTFGAGVWQIQVYATGGANLQSGGIFNGGCASERQ